MAGSAHGQGELTAPEATPAGQAPSWRGHHAQAGGGALLDLGYHLVDLALGFVGPFELVSAVMLAQGRLARPNELEDRVMLRGRQAGAWISLDSWVHGEPDPATGGCRKDEGLWLRTERGVWRADRSHVWQDGVDTPLHSAPRDWGLAMARQLDEFAQRMDSGDWFDPQVWDQLPAMRLIDQAYQQAQRF